MKTTNITPKDTRTIKQVSSKDLQPPQKPAEVTEQDVDFSGEEQALEKLEAELKEKRKQLSLRKKQAIGGKKLEKMRKYAQETTAWASKALSQLKVSVERANQAVGNLSDYEEKLGLPEKARIGGSLAGMLTRANSAVEAELKD